MGVIYFGLDFSLGMFSATDRHGDNPTTLGDCTRLPFRANSFDGLLGATVLQNIPREDEAFLEISRVLKDGCRAVISFPERTTVDLSGIEKAGLICTRKTGCHEDIALRLEKPLP